MNLQIRLSVKNDTSKIQYTQIQFACINSAKVQPPNGLTHKSSPMHISIIVSSETLSYEGVQMKSIFYAYLRGSVVSGEG